jgi:hypothetical protein
MTGSPSVLAYQLRSSPVHIGFWCPWCKGPHLHGSSDGHRASHCHKAGSPLAEGYHLIYAGTVADCKQLPRFSREDFIATSHRLNGVVHRGDWHRDAGVRLREGAWS